MAGNINYLVTDASFLLSFLFPDENNSQTERVLDGVFQGKIKLVAPLLLPFEIFNGFCTAFIRKRVSLEVIKKLSEQFFKLNIMLQEVDHTEVLKLAVLKKITFYDASYLYLAKSQNLPLLTLDQKLTLLVSN